MNRDAFWKAGSDGTLSLGMEGPGIVSVIIAPAFVLVRVYPTSAAHKRELRSLGSGGGKSQLSCNSSFQIYGPKISPIRKLSG